MALKLDKSKVYGRIDWNYLRELMLKIGFDTKWVNWIMMSLDSVQYVVVVNQDLVGPIIPGRGLNQGDPLSPYLFILCADGLSSLIHQAEARGDIHGTKVCKNAPIISHLLFADGRFLFFKATTNEARTITHILKVYEEASRQMINFQKSKIYCSKNVANILKDGISAILGVKTCLGIDKYLGLSSMVGRRKKSTFCILKGIIWKKINSWSNMSLSRAGRKVLIKSVLQSIHTNMISVFLLPSTLGDEI